MLVLWGSPPSFPAGCTSGIAGVRKSTQSWQSQRTQPSLCVGCSYFNQMELFLVFPQGFCSLLMKTAQAKQDPCESKPEALVPLWVQPCNTVMICIRILGSPQFKLQVLIIISLYYDRQAGSTQLLTFSINRHKVEFTFFFFDSSKSAFDSISLGLESYQALRFTFRV